MQEAVEQLLEQKQTLEAAATQQAQLLDDLETSRQKLEDANKALSAQVEAVQRNTKLAGVPMPAPAPAGPSTEEIAARKKLEDQLAKANAELAEAKDELTRISVAESSQRM